jgi:hypothetical protein
MHGWKYLKLLILTKFDNVREVDPTSASDFLPKTVGFDLARSKFKHLIHSCVQNSSCVALEPMLKFLSEQNNFCMEKPAITQKLVLKTTKICIFAIYKFQEKLDFNTRASSNITQKMGLSRG